MNAIRSPVADEEDNLFPRLCRACPAVVLNESGDKVRQAEKTAPPRPHPSRPVPTPPPPARLRPTSSSLPARPPSTGCGTP
ncbi:hypothetical protein GCM10010275_39870 [Streptomyces litmocidini]|nr:hypothetical protein GCM10010275_39870 [Streptomyces litmocidini]